MSPSGRSSGAGAPSSPGPRAGAAPPTARGARFVVAAELAVMFAGSTLLTPLYDVYRRAFGFSELTVTLVYAVYAAGNVLALVVVGRLSDQIGRRPAALLAIAGAALASTWYLAAERSGPGWLFAGRVLSGLAIGVASGTATAWIAELTSGDLPRASVLAAIGNFVGIAAGPLLAGFLAQYLPGPLRLAHRAYLALLVVTALAVATIPETVRRPVRRLRDLSLRPRVGVPRQLRARFVAPAATIFAAFALVGFYASLVPTVLRRDLHRANLAEGGVVAALMFLSGAAGVQVTRRLRSRRTTLLGLEGVFASLALLVVAEGVRSMPVLLVGTVIGGVSAAMSYRGGLQVVNELAPPDRRAEVISSYLLMGFLGNALPVVGIGVLSGHVSPRAADLCFSAAIAAVTIMALVTGARRTPRPEPSPA